MTAAFLAMAMLALIASSSRARIIDWQAELDHCRALRENVAPLLQAGEGVSAIARSGAAARRCAWIERRAARRKLTGGGQK